MLLGRRETYLAAKVLIWSCLAWYRRLCHPRIRTAINDHKPLGSPIPICMVKHLFLGSQSELKLLCPLSCSGQSSSLSTSCCRLQLPGGHLVVEHCFQRSSSKAVGHHWADNISQSFYLYVIIPTTEFRSGARAADQRTFVSFLLRDEH